MIPYRSKAFWIILAISLSLLVIIVRHELKIMKSSYKTNMGMGVFIYADDYVKTGKWIFNCGTSRIVSRQPLPVPTTNIRDSTDIVIGKMYTLDKSGIEHSKKFIQSVIINPNWYNDLHYQYSFIGENNELRSHLFGLISHYDGRPWALSLWQEIGNGGASSFELTARPYDAAEYADYPKALRTAAMSCPGLQ